MKITAYLHLFPPEHNAGSETTVHAAFRALVNRGHSVKVICNWSKTAPYSIDGIDVVRPPRRGDQKLWLESIVADSDLLVTHLDMTSPAMTLAMNVKIPLVHFVHNGSQLMCWRVDARVPYKNALTVYNSHWLARQPSSWGEQDLPKEWECPHSIIMHPVVEPRRYRCERGESITLVNPTSGKGADTFYELATRMPDRPFLTAQGGYGIQVPCPRSGGDQQRVRHTFYDDKGTPLACAGLPNVTHLKNDPDIRNIFQRTKILLMPSDYESYGRVGIEAACAGIPTIAHPTEGLKEAFGEAGIFIDRNDIAAWYLEVDRLLTDDVYYRQRSNAVLALADSLDPESEFDRLEQAFVETAERYKSGENQQMKMWKSDRWIYKMQDGTYKAMDNPGRIPVGAVTQIAGRGTLISEALARENGWIGPDAKAIEGPEENKAITAPQETKQRGRKKSEDVAA